MPRRGPPASAVAEARRRGRPSGATLGAAVAVGVILAAAAMIAPLREWRRSLARPATLAAILDADPATRREAWAVLEPDLRDAESRDRALAEIDFAAESALRQGPLPDPAIADLALRLDRFAAWRWDREAGRAVIERSIAIAAEASNASADPALVAFAAQRLLDFPNETALPVAPSSIAAIWNRVDPPMQARLLPRLASLEPRSRREILGLLETAPDPRPAGLLLLARLAADGDPEAAMAVANDRTLREPLRDRAAATAVRLDPLAAFALLAEVESEPQAPWATILAPAATEPAVRAALETRVAAGEAAPRRLLARLDAIANGEAPEAEAHASAWDLLSDPASPPDARRLAALLLVEPPGEELPESALANLLDGPLADADGSVLASVLLAEATGQARRATSWVRSLEDDRKRAGAMLAVLSDGRHGADAAAIARTQDAASDPTIRSRLRAASWAFASPRHFGTRDAEREFVHRISHRGDRGELDLDVLALRLAAGDPEAVDALLAMSEDPASDRPEAIERWSTRRSLRWLLVERFVPTLAASLGPPLGGSRRELALQADLALVAWWSRRSELRFDPSARRWIERRGVPSAGRPRAAAIARHEHSAHL